MDAMTWGLAALTDDCNPEMAIAGLDLVNDGIYSTIVEPEVISQKSIYPVPGSVLEDEGSPVLKLFYSPEHPA